VWFECFPENPPLPPDALDATVRKKLLIRGLQGKFYRLLVKQSVESVSSEVTNLPDGTVQILVTGSEGRVEAFKKDLTTGSNLVGADQIEEITLGRDSFPMDFVSNIDRPDIVSILLFLLGPDPLEMLCRRVVGVPDSVPQE
jgi:acylphosphatase